MEMEGSNDVNEMNVPLEDSTEHYDVQEYHEEELEPPEVTHTLLSSKRKSAAWLHFRKGKKLEDKKIEVICNYCGIRYPYVVENGTSTMLKHLQKCPKYHRNIDKRQKIFTACSRDVTQDQVSGDTSIGSANLTTWIFDQNLCRHMLAKMIIMDEQPFSLVERVGFRNFVSQLQHLFKHISRFTVARDCMKLYFAEKCTLKASFRKLKSRVALTTDMWTSIQNLSYLCHTAHFIDDKWTLHKRIINFVVSSEHKGKDIARVIEKCIYEWGIEKKVSTITIDNAPANDAAIKILKEKFSRDKLLILDGDVLHMRCTAHVLNLIVKEGLSEIGKSIVRIRNAVKYVRSSPMRVKTFQTCIESARITYKGSACLDVSTRWNSTYLMLDTALKLRKAFDRLEEDDPAYLSELDKETPQHEDWEKTKVFVVFLKKFYDATNKMSETLYITSNNYFTEITALYKNLKQAEHALDPRVKAMGKKTKEKFDRYYGTFDKVNMMVLIAVVLDPRKKMNYVRYCYKLVYDDAAKVDEMYDMVRIALERLFQFYERTFRDSCGKTLGSQSLIGTGPTNGSWDLDSYEEENIDDIENCLDFDSQKAYEGFLDEEKQDLKSNLSELDMYLKAKREGPCELDLLIWWKTTGQKFKILSFMARDILSIPVTTVASESAFSTSGRILDGFRSSLTPPVVEALICTQDWLRIAATPINIEECIENAEKFEWDMNDVAE